MMERAKHCISEDPERVTFIYLDGHARIYHGKHSLSKTKKPQDQVAKPAATDHWSILTTNGDLEKALVVYRQFNRWRQENFFKDMEEEFELDGLLEYGADPVSPEADRPNPARRPWERRLATARQRFQSLRAELGSEVNSDGAPRQRTVRGFQIAHCQLRAQIADTIKMTAYQVETQLFGMLNPTLCANGGRRADAAASCFSIDGAHRDSGK
jgi:hypothetical protein